MEFIATITKIMNTNDNILGVYVNFNEDQSGFIPLSQLKLKNKQIKKFKEGRLPDYLQVGKQLKVKIIRNNGEYHDLAVVK